MLVLLPMLAFGGWRQVGTLTPTTAGDVQVVDAGVVLAVSSSTATVWHVSDAGVVTQVNTFTSAGMASAASFGSSGCIMGVTATGNIVVSPGCGSGSSLGAFIGRVIRLLTPQLGVAIFSSAGTFDSVYGGPGPAPGWASMGGTLSGSGTRTLQVSRIGGIDYAVANGGNGVRVSVDGGVPTGAVVGTTALRDAAPFPLAGAPAIFGATTTSLVLVRDYRSPTVFSPAMPAGLNPRYVAMGNVTGMVTTLSGVVLSPIPDPNRVAEVWKVRPGPPSEWLTEKIHCVDDRYCATMTDGGVVYLYENEVAPGVTVAPVVAVEAGQVVRLRADAGDGDGDPIYVSWDAGVFAAVSGIDDGTEVDFTAPATVPVGVCETTIDVTVSDGLLAHDRTIQVPIPFIQHGTIQLSAASTTPIAGGAPVMFSAFIDGGCNSTAASLTWSEGTQVGSGATFTWSPPATVCNADGGQVTITTTATWSAGSPSMSAQSQVVLVQPWGAPEAPVFPPDASQASGSDVSWRPIGIEHVCSSSAGFPGTTLIWSNYDSDAGTPFDGGLRIVAPRTCTPLQLTATAQRVVFGEDAGRSSDAGVLVVDIIPETAVPLPATTEFFISVGGDAGHVFGVLKADAGCAEERGLTAMVTVFTGGAFVADGGFSPLDGGEWDLQVPGGCSGGRYDVVAELYEGTRPTGAVAQGFVDLTFSTAKVGTLSVDRLDVVCGDGARAPLVLVPAAGACGASEVTWRATAGPPLVTGSGSGETINLQTAALDFSSVGQQIVLEFVADAGAGNLDVATRTIDLGVQPFLEVSVQANPPLRREEEAVSLEVTLRNTTSCAVEGLSVTLPFSGGSPILDSVLIDGVRIAARVTDQGVVVDGVSVPGDGVAKLQLSARARLLSTPTVEPFVSLGGFVVSTLTPKTDPPTGCGCSQLASPAFLALALLVLRRRRRSPG